MKMEEERMRCEIISICGVAGEKSVDHFLSELLLRSYCTLLLTVMILRYT